MADTKYSGLAVTTASSSNIWGVAQSGTSWAVYESSVALVPKDRLILGQKTAIEGSSAASTITMFSQDFAGRQVPTFVDVGGINTRLQPCFLDSDIWQWYPTSNTVGQYINGINFNIGSFSSAPTPTVGSRYLTSPKGTYRGSTGAANMNAGVGRADNAYYQGSTAGAGGYFFYARFGLDTFASSTRYFVGLTQQNSSAICTSNITTMINAVGFGFNAQSTAADPNGTSFIFFHASTGAGTTEPLLGQPALATGNAYEAYIYAPPNTTRIYYRLDDFNARSTLVNSSVGVHLPNVTSLLKSVAMTGQLNTSSGSCRIGIVKLYCERVA